MSPMDDRTFEELKDSYVLGALPEEERAAFEAYLEAHPERQAEVEDLVGVAGLLALSPPEHEPSNDLKRRIMGVVEPESSRPRAAGRRASSWLGGFMGFKNLALGAAAVLLVGLLSWNVLLQGDVRDLRGQVEEARSAEEPPADGPEEIQQIQLGGSWADQGAHAEVTAMKGDRSILVVENVPSIPDDRTLQIWVIVDDVPKPSGLLEPAGDMAATAITTPLGGADTLAVTIEPAGGSEEPTTDPVLATEI